MDYFLINGGKPLKGKLKINGAKNAALPILAATLLIDGISTIKNVPILKDTMTMLKLMESLGSKISIKNHTVIIDNSEINNYVAEYELVKTMRASIYVMAPLLARFGQCKVAFPGGCSLGVRPINIHLNGFEKMGVSFDIEEGYVIGNTKQLNGVEIELEFPSVGATANLLIAAVLGKGTTRLFNYAKEPEIFDLINFLRIIGAKINYTNEYIEIIGVKNLKTNKEYTVMMDRIELGTFGIMAIATKGNVDLIWENEDCIVSVRKKIEEMGSIAYLKDNIYHFEYKKLKGDIYIKTQPYPGFPTDLQPPLGALLTINEGTSIIDETIFENRFMWVSELIRMGANINKNGNTVVINGVKQLKAAPIMVSDIRAGAALMVAALAAEGESKISRVYHIDRGYEKIEERLRSIGADIVRKSE